MNTQPSNQQSEFNLSPDKLRNVLNYLYDGVPETHFYMLNINDNYVRGHLMLLWLAQNKLKGKKLVEFFKNCSEDGEGVLPGVSHILSRLDGKKHSYEHVKAWELK